MNRVLAAAAVLLVAATAVLLITHRGSDAYELTVEFKNLSGLRKNSNVKIGGVPGGRITHVDLTARDTALATVELDDGVKVGTGATAAVRPVNLLGEKYIDLDPGDLGRPQPSGTKIPTERTSAPVELDDVLNTLKPDSRAALRVLINEAGVAMAGRGADFNSLLDELPPAIDQTRRVVGALGEDTQQLRDMIERGDRVLAAIVGRGDDLTRLVREAGGALEVTAQRRADLGSTVSEGASTMRQLRETLGELDTTAAALVPASRQLRITAAPLTDTLRATPGFVRDATPLLNNAVDVSPDLARLGRRGTPTIKALRPTAARLSNFARQAAPTVATADAGGAVDGLLGLMQAWVSTIKNSDGLSHVFRLRLQPDETLVTTLTDKIQAYVTAQSAPRNGAMRAPVLVERPAPSTAKPVTSTPPASSPPAPATPPGGPQLPVPDLPGTLDDQLRDPQKTVDDVTNLLDFLLGN